MQNEGMSTEDGWVIDLPGYELIRLLGKGGQASVYLAKQLSFQRNVAIKILRSFATMEQSYIDSFMQEARTVANLSHPHIIPVYDFGQKDDYFYLVMEYCTGSDLKTLIKTGIVEEEILKTMEEIASALAFSHDRGVFHLDIKPENIMFRQDNSAILMDYGIARRKTASDAADEDKLLGTPTYMSPEQLVSEKVDGRADIYSLGVVFYEMLTGKPPYEDDNIVALAKKHLNAPLPELPLQYRKYQGILNKMLAKEANDRYQTALEVAKIFHNLANNLSDPELLTGAIGLNPDAVTEKNRPGTFFQRKDMEFLQELHPLLDKDWATRLKGIFGQLDEHKRKYVYERILIPKGISYDSGSGGFIYNKSQSIDALTGTLSNAVKMLAAKLQQTRKKLDSLQDPLSIADLMESSLSMIDSFECQDNIDLQHEKILLRNAYLNDLIQWVQAAQFNPLQGERPLDPDAIKTYMLEVFLRHQILGYRYRTWPSDELQKQEHAFLRDFVADEVATRKCVLVRTSHYLFVIGAVKDISHNPFSIRRFLHEDEVLNRQYIFFNGICIDLSRLDDAKEIERISWEMSRIVTLERQLSPGIVEIIKDMENAQKECLHPMLQENIAADGANLELNIRNRLVDYERELTLSVLNKLATGIAMAKTTDDMEYLFLSVRQLLVDIAGDIRDFHMSPAMSWSQSIEDLELKIIAYIKLMEKRYDQLFRLDKPVVTDDESNPAKPISEFKQNIKKGNEKISAAKKRLEEAREHQQKLERSLLYRWTSAAGSWANKRKTPEEIEAQIIRLKHESLVGFIRICKRYAKIVVYLEFEQLVEFDKSKRHYALPSGDKGLTRLPVLITLYEDPRLLDMGAILESLYFDILRNFPTSPKVAHVK